MTSISLVNQGLKPLIVVALGCVFFFRNPGEVRQFFGDQKWINWIQWKNSPSWWWRFYQLQRVVTWSGSGSVPSENGPKVFFSPKWRGLSSNHCFLRGRVKLQGSINTCCIWYFYYIYRYIFYMTVLALRCWDHHLYYQTSRYIKRICRHFLSRHSLLGISGWSADEWFKICGSKMILYIYTFIRNYTNILCFSSLNLHFNSTPSKLHV